MKKPDEVLYLGLKPPEQACLPEYIQYQSLLSPPECAEIIRIGCSKPLEYAGVGNGGNNTYEINKSKRTVKSCGLRPEDGLEWLFHRLAQRVAWTNNEHFRFHLSGFNEAITFLQYEMSPDSDTPCGHYDWHQDYGGGYSSLRKLSVVVQLSHPDNYNGCRLHLMTYRDLEVPEIGAGDTIIFPSYLPHKVTPLQRGIRHALALWVSGPQFV